MTSFLRTCHGIMNVNLYSVGLEFVNQVSNFRISQIRTIFLEGQAQNVHSGASNVNVSFDNVLYCLLRDELRHAVVNTAAGENDLRYVANHFCLVSKVVW